MQKILQLWLPKLFLFAHCLSFLSQKSHFENKRIIFFQQSLGNQNDNFTNFYLHKTKTNINSSLQL
jgi:hypothetical protein